VLKLSQSVFCAVLNSSNSCAIALPKSAKGSLSACASAAVEAMHNMAGRVILRRISMAIMSNFFFYDITIVC
jgi:hypothetical protein